MNRRSLILFNKINVLDVCFAKCWGLARGRWRDFAVAWELLRVLFFDFLLTARAKVV